MARAVACCHSPHQTEIAAGCQSELEQRAKVQLEAVVEASAVYACQAASEQDGWGALGNAPDAHALGGQAPAEQAVVGDALGQQTDQAE